MPWVEAEDPQAGQAPQIGKLDMPSGVWSLIQDASAKHGVDPLLVQSVMAVESNYKYHATSKKNAQGLMQIIPGTQKILGIQDAYNPYENIEGGTKLIADLLKRYNGDIQKTLWAYNAGPEKVAQGIMPAETSAYIPAVMAAYRQARGQGIQEPEQTGGRWVEVEETPPPTAQLQPGKVAPIPELVGQALLQPESLESKVAGYIPQGVKDTISSGAGYMGKLAQKLTPSIPMQGAIAGGWSGGKLGAMTGNPLGATAGALIGAGLGYAGAEQAENVSKFAAGEQMPSISEQLYGAGKGFLTGATAEMGGQSFGKMMQPFARRISDRIAEDQAIREAQKLVEQGAPISPSVISGSRTARGLEWLAEKVWPASSKMAKQRNSLQGFAESLKDEFVASRGLYDTSKGRVGAAWDNWVKLAGGADAVYPMPKTTQILNEAMGKPFAKTGAFWTKHAATFAEEANSGQVTVQGIRNLFNTLSPQAAKGAERSARMKIADAIVEDLGNVGGPEAIEALSIARQMTFMNRVVAPLRAIFNNSMIEPKAAGEVVRFSPSKFVNLWNQRRAYFLDNKNYSEIDIAVIDKFANQMRAMIPDLAKGAGFTPPTSLGGVFQANLENPLAVAGMTYKYPWLALPVGADYLLAGSLMSPKGVMRRFLTTGLKPPVFPVKLGIMKGMEND